ncbi:MAG: hypothetical protein EHM93_14310 [Bacteroidales bacterium]|nr:MAG: hypothetical protein EHM93_14310 [Bacteroidales bacterium]
MKIKILACTFLGLLFLAMGCKKEDKTTIEPKIILKNGADYSIDEQLVPVGGKLKFGITASDGGAIITNLRIQRIADGKLITELDKGLYIKNGGLDFDYSANKSSANQEIWQFFVMNSNRDSAITTITINLGAGSAYGEIYHYPSIKIGMQSNTEYPNYLDLHIGTLFTKANVTGHEADVDLVGFVYTTSGILSPTLCCPGYTGSSSVTGSDRYPEIEAWSVKRLTQYDYFSSDNNLVNPVKFNQAANDSLLVASYKPESVSGLCKYCNAGKIIPFRTEDGKYGLARVIHADLANGGYMELDVKIQK